LLSFFVGAESGFVCASAQHPSPKKSLFFISGGAQKIFQLRNEIFLGLGDGVLAAWRSRWAECRAERGTIHPPEFLIK
jgi:hypothetical protein